ncbi:M20 family metallopeptidase [Intestinibacter sp.]
MDKVVLEKVYNYIDSQKEAIVKTLEEVVNIESYGYSKEDVNKVAIKFKALFDAEGFECKLIPAEPNGYCLSGILGKDRPGKPIMFAGHMDTALEIGTLAKRPFKVVDGKAEGIGVLDMKGGIVIALYVIKALNSIGYADRPIKVLFAGDEEANHIGSNAAEIMMAEAKDGLCAFNMETGLIDNAICVGRKGRIGVQLTVEGVPAHAGNDFKSGRNAIAEMAYKIIELQKITDLDAGITCSTTKVIGGHSPNAIPKECTIDLDVRFDKVSQLEEIKSKIEAIANNQVINQTSCTVNYISKMMPYEDTDENMRLYGFIRDTAKEFGFRDFGYRKVGGSSDASYLTIAGVPTLCSCGVVGEWNHTMQEYAIVDTMYERAKLFATAVLNIDKFEK